MMGKPRKNSHLKPVPERSPIPLQQRPDDDLMLLARGGNEAAFDTLIVRHQRPVLRFAMKYVGSAAASRDIAQNTFVELYRYLPTYEARGSFQSFVFRIALNQCRMAVRRSKYDRSAREALAAEPLPRVCGPDDKILARERQRDVERALTSLSPKLREVVTLRFNAELRYDEIAAILRIPVGTVKSRLFAALESMRKKLRGGSR